MLLELKWPKRFQIVPRRLDLGTGSAMENQMLAVCAKIAGEELDCTDCRQTATRGVRRCAAVSLRALLHNNARVRDER
jgi:hypothetical protein